MDALKSRDEAKISEISKERKRITRTGDLLRLETNPTVPKALGIIQVKETSGELTGQDRKAINWLLHNAFDKISEPVVHEAKESELRKYLSSHQSNDRIKDITKRLGSTLLSYDYLDEDGLPQWGYGTLITISGSTRDDLIRYEFPHWLRPLLAEPAKWARLSLRILQKFSSKYAVTLYENLEVHANKDHAIWPVSVDDLRVVLGVAEGKLKTFNDLTRRVIEPALREVNEHADFVAKFEIAARHGRKVTNVRFVITKKPERKDEEKTAKYRAIEPAKTFVGKVPVKDRTREMVRNSIAKGWDIYVIEADFQEFAKKNGMPKDPDKAFVGYAKTWVATRTKNQRTAKQGNLLM